jgi:hypothetical protein
MLTTLQSWYGDRGAYQYAEIYSQWGNTPKALAWLEEAMRLGDSGLAARCLAPQYHDQEQPARHGGSGAKRPDSS